MDAARARELLDLLAPVPTCKLCGMTNPPTREEYFAIVGIGTFRHDRVHRDCPGTDGTLLPVVEVPMPAVGSVGEWRDALQTILRLSGEGDGQP